MKTKINVSFHRFHLRLLMLALSAFCFFGAATARAGLTMQVDLERYNYLGEQGYEVGLYITTNDTPPNAAFGDYLLASPGYPTNANAAWVLCHVDTNGFSDVAGYSSGFSSFDAPDFSDSLIQNLTNGLWSVFVTNTVTTNVYYFTATATIDSNAIPLVQFTYPTNDATDVTNLPVFTWDEPTNYDSMILYGPNFGESLPPTQTSLSGLTLLQGVDEYTLDSYYQATNVGLIFSMPLDASSNALSGWASFWHVWDEATIQFSVGPPVDTSGTAHTLVAHYTWDATNADGSASGADSSGNDYNLDFSGTFGTAGGVSWTTNAIVGPGAISFADGDANSGGYAGWNETPTNILAAIAGSFSISCWVNTTQNFDYAGDPASFGAGIVSAYTGGVANDVIPLALTGGQAAFSTGGSEDDTLTSNGSVNDGNNHFVVVTRNQLTGQKIIYIDGLLDNYAGGTTNLLTDAQALTIGALANAYDPYAIDAYYYNGYNGVLDDLQIYSGVLSSNEVATLYANPGTTLANISADTLTITASPLSGTVALTVQFTSPDVDSDGNAVTNWVWTFGDGGTSTNESPSYTYSSTGSYTPTLVAQSVGGVFPTVIGPGVISVTPPQIKFSATPLAGPAPLHVQFTGPSVDAAGYTITNWAWSFGDGATSTAKNPETIYDPLGGNVSGSYTPSLTVQSDGGVVSEVTAPGPVVVAPADAGTVFATASPSSGAVPLTVHFSCSDTDTGGDPATNWVWVFGDGATSTNQNPTHTYSSPNNYSPTLVAECSGGLIASVELSGLLPGVGGSGYLSATNPILAVTASPLSGAAPLTVQFTSPATDSVRDPVTRWTWNFGDGTTSSAQNPAHTYAGNGTYQPSLVAYSYDLQVPLTVTGPAAILATNAANPVANLPGYLASFTFNNFANAASLQLNGSALALTTSDGPVLELTPAATGQAGSAFIAQPIAFGPHLGFSTFFMFRLHNSGGEAPADGITFTVQGDSAQALGNTGGQLGYTGIPDSFCVDFKTFDDGTLYGSPGDPNDNYVGLNINGGLNDPLYTTVTNAPLSDGNIWYAWIDYEGVSQDFEVRLSETPVRPLTPMLDAVVDLPAVLAGATNAFVGFTGGTGDGWQQQDILAWKFMALPTTRFTGVFSLTNTLPGFQFNNGLVLVRYSYVVAGITYTNYSYSPINSVSNANAQLAFSTGLAELAGNSKSALAGLNPNALDIAISNNAAAINAADNNSYAVLGTYQNADLNVEGAVVCTYDAGAGSTPSTAYYANNSFENTFNLTETSFETLVDMVNPNSAKVFPGLFPPSELTQIQTDSTTYNGPNSGVWLSTGDGGYITGDAVTYSYGTVAGTVATRTQIVASPPLPLYISPLGTDGTNFNFEFSTVLNQGYTIWANTNLTTTNWIGYTNLTGGGYVQAISVPTTNAPQTFFRLTSP